MPLSSSPCSESTDGLTVDCCTIGLITLASTSPASTQVVTANDLRIFGRSTAGLMGHQVNTTQTQRKHNASATYLTNQPTNQPDAGARAAPLRREEIPPTLLTQAKSLIELYKSVVTAAHPAGLAVENLIANVLASHPTRTPGAWEHAVKTYGDDCRKNGRLAQSPRTFFEGTWSEFIDVKLPSMKPQEDIISELRERNARSAQAARGVQCPHNQT